MLTARPKPTKPTVRPIRPAKVVPAIMTAVLMMEVWFQASPVAILQLVSVEIAKQTPTVLPLHPTVVLMVGAMPVATNQRTNNADLTMVEKFQASLIATPSRIFA